MPFGPYENFKDCVKQNQDKEDPEAYCAEIQEQVEGSDDITKDNNVGSVTSTIPIKIIATEDENIFTIAAAKVGSKSFGAYGKKYVFTEEALKTYAESWNDGIITLNHGRLDDGVIVSSWYDEETQMVMMNIKADNEETAKRIRDGEPTGVSIEANVLGSDDDGNILSFDGTGVGIIFYPEQPACPAKDGCGILAKEQFDEKIVTASEKRQEKIKSSEYDLARTNDAGDTIKIAEVVIWDDMGESEKDVEWQITNYVTYYGEGSYELLEYSDTKVGDTVSGTPEYTVNISVNKSTTNGEISMANDSEPEVIAKADYEALEAKMKSLEDTHKDEIEAKDSEIKELKDEINRRDSEIAASLVEEIKAWDTEFEPEEGMPLATIQTIHASVKRAIAVQEEAKASEQEEEPEEEIEASEFTAPEAGKKSDGFTIGGIVNGKWVSK